MKRILIIIIVTISFIFGFFILTDPIFLTEGSVVLSGKNITETFIVKVAQTHEEITRGLSRRYVMPRNKGMLFVFPNYSKPVFWMKGMKFPLDLVWIKDDRIADISRNVPIPENGVFDSDLPTYVPKNEINYVLEVRAWEASKFIEGDRVDIHIDNTR